ncbi:MAG: hypothetical protein M1519_01040 [Actinobacteria bacterium]|nr:hypothetical protein [Actinomycetota bacterium]
MRCPGTRRGEGVDLADHGSARDGVLEVVEDECLLRLLYAGALIKEVHGTGFGRGRVEFDRAFGSRRAARGRPAAGQVGIERAAAQGHLGICRPGDPRDPIVVVHLDHSWEARPNEEFTRGWDRRSIDEQIWDHRGGNWCR